MGKITDFAQGLIAGFVLAMLIVGVIAVGRFYHNRDKELLEYAERQRAVELMREDYGNRDPYEFLDGISGVRDAAERAKAAFERQRDEAVQRFGSSTVD